MQLYRHMDNRFFPSLLLCLALLLSLPATAADNKPLDKAQAAQKAKQATSGRVLKVDQQKNKYRVKVLKKSGRVVSVDVDKKSGKVTRKKDKD